MDMARARRRLTAHDWADAALAAIGERGLAAVAVEPLAARLGTTKGSFYWHFANRDALIAAALGRWEEIHTEQIITEMETEPDPERRLQQAPHEGDRGGGGGSPGGVTARHGRSSAGGGRDRAGDEAARGVCGASLRGVGLRTRGGAAAGLLAYASYLGHTQLSHAVPQALPVGVERAVYLESVMDTLLRAGSPGISSPSGD